MKKFFTHKSVIVCSALVVLVSVLVLGTLAFTGSGGEKVKVKITKIVDGDTTVTEKWVEESGIDDLVMEFSKSNGKNTIIMVEAVKEGKKQKNVQSKVYMKFDDDSGCGAHAWAGSFNFDVDSVIQNAMKGFCYSFNSDDEKNEIVISRGGKTVKINCDSTGGFVKKIETDENGKKEKTVIAVSKGGNNRCCVIVNSSVVMEDNPAGKKDEKTELKTRSMNFYPNPSADGKFNLEFELAGKEPATITILDMNGKEVYSETVNGEGKIKKEINLGKKASGTYILNIVRGEKSLSKKIIIE